MQFLRYVPRSMLWRFVLLAGLMIGCQLPWWLDDPAWNGWLPPFTQMVDPAVPDHLGFEHLHVAKSICEQGSFSDPFGEPTGPTAWVAPLMPSLLAVMWCATKESLWATTVLFLLLQLAILEFGIEAVYRSTRTP